MYPSFHLYRDSARLAIGSSALLPSVDTVGSPSPDAIRYDAVNLNSSGLML